MKERKVTYVPSATYDSIRVGQKVRSEGQIYIVVSKSRRMDSGEETCLVILDPGDESQSPGAAGQPP